jgi:hypothetical protein
MMEYCAHGSLGSIIDTFKAVEKQLTEKQLAHILYQAITGLAYLHNDQIKVVRRMDTAHAHAHTHTAHAFFTFLQYICVHTCEDSQRLEVRQHIDGRGRGGQTRRLWHLLPAGTYPRAEPRPTTFSPHTHRTTHTHRTHRTRTPHTHTTARHAHTAAHAHTHTRAHRRGRGARRRR